MIECKLKKEYYVFNRKNKLEKDYMYQSIMGLLIQYYEM